MKPLYSPAQWSLIDLANQYGLDKKPFDERLEWGRSILPLIKNADGLMDLHDVMADYIEKADEPELFTASLLNIWDICHNKPTGHYIELDSASSGCQLLSVLTRCITGMRNTGAIGNEVPDLYQAILKNMKEIACTESGMLYSDLEQELAYLEAELEELENANNIRYSKN